MDQLFRIKNLQEKLTAIDVLLALEKHTKLKGLAVEIEKISASPCEPLIMRPCPFCGGEPNGRCVEFVNKKFFQISCKNEKCLMRPETAMIDDENRVVEIWNSRA